MELISSLVVQLAPEGKACMKKNLRISASQSIISIMLLAILSVSLALSNVPLHEWTSSTEESNFTVSRSLSGAETTGELEHITPENLTTWIFEDGTFIPMAKLQGEKAYSIITDHFEGGALKKDVGHLFSERARLRQRETEAYDEKGDKVWSRQLNIYGETRRESGEKNFIPFLYQGQYFDEETELAYNRFRYYSPESGTYISQDPIRLLGQMPNMYSYVGDSNRLLDPLGLFTPKVLTEGTVYRGLNPKQSAYSPSSRDISHYQKKGVMPGISTFDDVDTVRGINKQYKLGMEKALNIDVSKLGDDLVAELDSAKGHVSIKPSDDYVNKNFGGDMVAALEDWKAGGDDHDLDKSVQNAVTGTTCL